MPELPEILSVLGEHFYLVIIGCLELIFLVVLLGAIPGRKKGRQPRASLPRAQKDRNAPGAKRILMEELARRSDNVCLMLRRSDLRPILAAGDPERLLGVTLGQLQDDLVNLLPQLQMPDAGRSFWKRYRSWDGQNALKAELELKNGQWLLVTVQRSQDETMDLFFFARWTEEYQKRQEYERRLAQAEAASQFKTSFLFRMSHEIRTPMNGIGGMLTLAEGKLPPEHPAMQYLKRADELSEHLLTLINDILDMARLEIPQYVQAVDLEEDEHLTVDQLVVPESVLHINTAGFALRVEQSYSVAEDNLNYRAQNGILYDRAMTAMLGIPARTVQLRVPESIQKVTLPQGVQTIGAQAFSGCTALRFIASNAKSGTLENGYDPALGATYNTYVSFLYAPMDNTGYSGNWTSFDAASGADHYEVVKTGALGRVLFSTDADGSPWLARRSGAAVDDTLFLPKTTLELFDCAFEAVSAPSGEISLVWDGVYDTVYIDNAVFSGAQLAGSLTLPPLGGLGTDVFTGCAGLTDVDFSGLSIWTTISAGLFTGCDALTDITLHEYVPPDTAGIAGIAFTFNGSWSVEEEAERLRLHIPAGAEESYVSQWRYLNAGGYMESPNRSA